MKANKDTRVLLIGWDAADWKIIEPLLKAGRMPNLQKLISAGCRGTIQTLDPPLSPMLWSSIATGKTADKHGILGFIEPDPITSEPRPAAVTSRNCKALWNILSQNGLRTNVIGWWPSHPAEPVNGSYVSNMFTKSEKGQALLEETVQPPELSIPLESARVFASDISIKELIPFVQQAASVDQEKDKHLHNLAALLSNCNSIFNAAKFCLEREDWNLTAVYFDTIDQVSHTFMKFYPPQINGVPDNYFDLYKEVVPQMYVHHDKMLGELLAAAGENTNVVLLSDHGFYSDHLRPLRLPNDPASPSLEHSQFGILVMAGPAIRKDAKIKGATLLDITPTLLNIFGLANAKDMDGRILEEVIRENVAIGPVESWEHIAGASGMHSKERQDNSWQSTAAMFQMMELGYIDRLSTDKEKSLRKIVSESNYYLARVLMQNQQYPEALNILEQLYQENGTVFRYGMRYLACLQHSEKQDEAGMLLKELHARFPREERTLRLADAILFSASGNSTDALELFKEIEKEVKHLPELYVMLGNECASFEDFDQAEKYYRKALGLDGQNVKALQGLMYIKEASGENDEELREQLLGLSRQSMPDLLNVFDGINDLDLDPDRRMDFRKYQLVIRLFLEQFHKGVALIK